MIFNEVDIENDGETDEKEKIVITKKKYMEYPDGTVIPKFVPLPKDMYDKMNRMKVSQNTRIVLGEVLAQTVGYRDETNKVKSVRRISHHLAADYISKCTGIPISSVNRAYNEIEKRKVFSTKVTPRCGKDKNGNFYTRNTKFIKINTNVDEWIEGGLPKKQQTNNTRPPPSAVGGQG